jgi:hypothetical protein
MVGKSLLVGVALLLLLPGAVRAQDALEKDFKQALAAGAEKEIEKICRVLVTNGTAASAKLICDAIPGAYAKATMKGEDAEPDIYWIVIRAAAGFQNSNGLNVTAEFLVDNKSKPFARDLCMALHNNFSPPCEEAMCKVLAQGTEELRVSALDHLMDIGKKPAVAAVCELLKKEGAKLAPEVSKRCFRLLATLTKQEFGDSLSNWTGWWDANSSKSWEELTKASGGGIGTTTLGNSRQNEYDKLKEAKVLIIRAGDKCKCKKSHDLDTGIDAAMRDCAWQTESVTKDVFENDPEGKYTLEKLNKTYIGIIAICTHIREHCACPNCKPGGTPSMRLFK